jgi:hypothetical protein
MIIVNLKGGLGNQMFQYAMGRRLSYLSNQVMKFDLTFLKSVNHHPNVTRRDYELSILNVQENFAADDEVKKYRNSGTQILNKCFPNYRANPYVKEKHFYFDSSIMTLSGDRYLDGHWMSEKYFLEIESIIRAEFTFKREILNNGKYLQSHILNSNSVCVQVRRGDYITNPKVAEIHQTTSLSYFEQGIALIKSKVKNPVFFVFSDDIKWCEENLISLKNVHFVEKQLAYEGADNSDYLQLMIACKHFIISNSTFAWWAAWLSASPGKIVVAPMNWFNNNKIITRDIYPIDWIKI